MVDWGSDTKDSSSSSSSKSTVARTPLAILEVLKQAKAWKVASLFTTRSSVRVDNFIFALHSTVTVTILTICMVFVGMKQYFGEPIECLPIPSTTNGITQAQMQHFCWMEGSFTIVPGNRRYERTGIDVAYSGVRTYKPDEGDLKMPHKYYQWVYYILCIQCIFFYIPKHIWKLREDDRLKTLIAQLKSNHILSVDTFNQYQLVQDTVDSILIANDYFYAIMFCEVIALILLIVQVWFIDLFLGGNFLYLGIQWLTYSHNSQDVHYDPLIKIFPRLTKCSFHKYSVSGELVTTDTLCFMSLNIVNEKIYVILWFWFLILLLVTIFHLLVYRAAIILFPFFRFHRIKAIAPTANKDFIRKLVRRPGTWFVLHTIASNLKPYYFRDLIERVQNDHFDEKMRLNSKVSIAQLVIDGKVPVASALTITVDKKKDKDKDSSKKKKKDKDKDNKDKDKITSQDSGTNDDGWGESTTENKDSNKNTNWDWEPSSNNVTWGDKP